MKTRLRALAAAAMLVAGALPALAQDFDAAEEARIKELALQAILERPEILREAIAILQRREQAAKAASMTDVIAARRQDLENDPNAPVLGAADADVAIVEFFDYNCPYCKRAVEQVMPVIEGDPGVRLVFREFPILGEGSMFAARLALASRAQGRYLEVHEALMELPRVTEASALKAAGALGLDMDRLRADMNAPDVSEHIALSLALARELDITGTPSFVIGDEIAPGLVPSSRLREMVSAAREAD